MQTAPSSPIDIGTLTYNTLDSNRGNARAKRDSFPTTVTREAIEMTLELKAVARLFAVGATLLSFSVMSADHAESPGTDADPAADIADVFIFPSPESPTKLVGAITFGGRPAPRSRIDGSFYCDPDILFTFNIDRADASGNFDSIPDVQIYARFGKNPQGFCGMQLENVPGASGKFSGPIEEVFAVGSGRAFAGLRNDPFFFDFEGFSALLNTFAIPGQNGDLVSSFRLTGNQPRRDSFAGRNVSAIVFEMDLDSVAPKLASGQRPKLRAWATTSRFGG
jgi:hypothetical protein